MFQTAVAEARTIPLDDPIAFTGLVRQEVQVLVVVQCILVTDRPVTIDPVPAFSVATVFREHHDESRLVRV